jgi:Ni/Fe-hydrogenase subunit HybB-like protein
MDRDRTLLQAMGAVACSAPWPPNRVGLDPRAYQGEAGMVRRHHGPLFIVSATVSGLALLLVCMVALRRVIHKNREDIVRRCGLMLFISIPVLGYFLLAEMMTTFYGAEPPALRVFLTMMSGSNDRFLGHLLVGLLLPSLILSVILLRVRRRWLTLSGGAPPGLHQLRRCAGHPTPTHTRSSPSRCPSGGLRFPLVPRDGSRVVCTDGRIGEDLPIGIAASMVTLGAFAERWNIVVPSLIGHSFLPFPTGSYSPTALELTLVAGVYAFGSLLFIGSAYLLPLLASEDAT